MYPILDFEVYELGAYRKAVKILRIPCQGKEGFEQTILQDLLRCYLFSTVRILKFFEQTMRFNHIVERLSALALFNENIQWVYTFVYPRVNPHNRVDIQDIIQRVQEFQEVLSNLLTGPQNVEDLFGEYHDYLTTLIEQPLPNINDPDCVENGRLVISYSKDCLIDAMIVQIEHLRSDGTLLYDDPNEELAKRIYRVLTSIQHSLKNQVILRDYDAYIVQNLSRKSLDQGHLDWRNKPVQLLDNIQKILDILQTDIPSFEDFNALVIQLDDYVYETKHGQLDN